MDVVFLITSLDRGGAETQLVRIALTLRRRGWKVGILTMLPSSAFLDDLKAADIPLVECISTSRQQPWRMIPKVVRQLRAWHPPVLVTFNFPADVMGRIAGKLAGVPAIIGSLRTAFVKNGLRRLFYRLSEPLIALTVSNSKAAIDYMVARRLLTPKKTCVIPNGMLASNYPAPADRDEVRRELSISPDSFLWLAVGNLRAAKDYPTLLAAASLCAAAHPSFRLCVVGGGEELSSLLADVEARGLQGRVHFLGQRSDVPRVLVAADAFVLSSAWEGLPNTVMEAMASALPVVATNVGGVSELLEEGVSGFIVPARQPGALAERMSALMTLPAEAREAMGAVGRARMVADFDIERVVDQWEEALQLRHSGPATD
ncbi:glycosyltransferase [Geothrix sp. PMB-07]|uniref:glycosyltransferase n=1 Tax=Geothrix sp. PMB-07 TaxID=3068640 RepID=UPI0027418828|nr:glycosyltransferase [Geothrix sp. PMB-07]WLT30007.1 glycosyltransferase [Geothrix sp. PMB-07]